MDTTGNESILIRVMQAAGTVLEEITTDPIDEIRGHFTANLLREWIRTNSLGLGAKICALHFDVEMRTVAVFLLSGDGSFIYDQSGNRVVAVFAARSMDNEMQNIFRSDNIVVLAL